MSHSAKIQLSGCKSECLDAECLPDGADGKNLIAQVQVGTFGCGVSPRWSIGQMSNCFGACHGPHLGQPDCWGANRCVWMHSGAYMGQAAQSYESNCFDACHGPHLGQSDNWVQIGMFGRRMSPRGSIRQKPTCFGACHGQHLGQSEYCGASWNVWVQTVT